MGNEPQDPAETAFNQSVNRPNAPQRTVKEMPDASSEDEVQEGSEQTNDEEE